RAPRVSVASIRPVTKRNAYTPPPLSSPMWPPLPAVSPEEPLPYRRRANILSKGERALWYPLYRAVKGRYRIFCKVRLYDVVCCPDKQSDERRWFQKVKGYHVDFVICEHDTTAP